MSKWWVQGVAGLTALLLLVHPSKPLERQAVMYRDQVAVLVYHHLDDSAAGPVTISSSLLRRQLRHLQQRGFHFIDQRQFRAYMNGGSVPDNAVLVTFDDGYASYYDLALPVLRQLGVPAVNFIITETLEHPNRDELHYMSREQLANISASADGSAYESQCHTHALHGQGPRGPLLVTRLDTAAGAAETDAEYAQRIVRDAGACRRELEQADVAPVDSIAYPFGSFDEQSILRLGEAGFRYGYTVISEMADRSTDRMRLPRINAGSPYVSPERLYNAIVKRVFDSGDRADDDDENLVPIPRVARDLGFKFKQRGRSNNCELTWSGQTYRLEAGSTEVMVDDSRQLHLASPVERRGKTWYMRKKDLQRILNTRIEYMTNQRRYAVRQSPPRDMNEWTADGGKADQSVKQGGI